MDKYSQSVAFRREASCIQRIMSPSKKDPTDAIRRKASRYPGVLEGNACTQSSFKVGKKSFLFVGMQGGRYKLMFKLEKSLPEASKLAAKEPDRYGVGSTSWVTARFDADDPMPKKLWERWLDESYALSASPAVKKKPAAKRKVAKKKATRKKTAKKASSK